MNTAMGTTASKMFCGSNASKLLGVLHYVGLRGSQKWTQRLSVTMLDILGILRISQAGIFELRYIVGARCSWTGASSSSSYIRVWGTCTT